MLSELDLTAFRVLVVREVLQLQRNVQQRLILLCDDQQFFLAP